MRVKLQLVMCHDDGHEETITDVITLNKNNKRIEYLGLTLSEAKQLLSTTQHHLLRQQVDAFLDTCSDCPDCGTPLKLKSRSSRSFRTLFGTLKFYSPRLAHCSCKRRKTASFRPRTPASTWPKVSGQAMRDVRSSASTLYAVLSAAAPFHVCASFLRAIAPWASVGTARPSSSV